MADVPRTQQPYSNMTSYVSFVDPNTGKPPVGPKDTKRKQADLAMQGLVGAK